MQRARFLRPALMCLLLAAAAAPARMHSQSSTQSQPQAQTGAQAQPDASQPPQPAFRVGATYVRVDAFVTKDGQPVADLKADDFDVFEDGVKQTIRNFELVNIPSGFTRTAPRSDPNTTVQMRERVADPRRRVFVLFLDTYHVAQGASMQSRQAFLRFIERIVGPEDLIAAMTPEMSPEALTFGSRTETLEGFLNSVWGRRDTLHVDPEEDLIDFCYGSTSINLAGNKEALRQIKERRRAKLTLDALDGLVTTVGQMRDERKAIITVTEGWEVYRDELRLNQDPTETDENRGLHLGPVAGAGPAGVRDRSSGTGSPTSGDCDKLRLEIANTNTVQQFRDLPDIANRANASFYVIDPRGLPATDDLMNAPSVTADTNALRNKLSNMRELAERTDGMALAYSNNLDAELKRIATDLSTYYLLGYDSTNAKLDGSYRALTVKVKRPGVLVRARRGYRAAILPSAGSSHSRIGGSETGNAPAAANTHEGEITHAVGSIMGTRADLPVRLRVIPVRLLATAGGNGGAAAASELRIVAELDQKVASADAWRQGGTAHFIVRTEGGETALSADATLPPNARVLTAAIPLPADAPPGPYHVQMRLTAQSHADAVSDAATVQVAAPGLIASPVMLRRGPATGLAYVATADVRFRRADRLRLEAPSRLPVSQVHVTAVDQRGQPLNLPMQVTDRQDGADTIIVVDTSLAPLAPGGYAIVLATSDQRVIVPFQLIP